MDRLNQMTCFVRTVETGSFAAAGKSLAMSSQLVGKQVAALEERLGVQLLVRTTRRHSLTEAGRAFFERVRPVVQEAEDAENAVLELGDKVRGQLVVSAPYTFGTCRLMPFVATWLARHEQVRLRLVLTDRPVDLVGEGFDAVIRIGALDDSSLVARRMAPLRLVAFASPDYLARRGVPQVPADLVGHECIVYDYWFKPSLTDWTFEKDGSVETVHVGGRINLNDGRAVVELALAGHGIALQDIAIVAPHFASGRLVHLFADHHGPTREMHIIFPRSRRVAPKLRAFVDALVAHFV